MDKTDEYNEQVKENGKLSHELNHLTTYYKDALKQVSVLEKTIEAMKASEASLNEIIASLKQ